jgi:FkbM family methyltransferase
MDLDALKLEQALSWREQTISLCKQLREPSFRPKYVMGRNIYSDSVLLHYAFDGVIDDYCSEETYQGLPIVRSINIPTSALVLNAAGGKTLTARRTLEALGIANVDYFAFRALSDNPLLAPIRFNENFNHDFKINNNLYKWIYQRLNDTESKITFEKLIKFRKFNDINFLNGFEQRESDQYFEGFLGLRAQGERFYDVGGYDGKTSLLFSALYPGFDNITIFEPDRGNFEKCREATSHLKNIKVLNVGLHSENGILNFLVQGSQSTLSATGTSLVTVQKLDTLFGSSPTYLKLDIEGAEFNALMGAKETIRKEFPRIAVAVYHQPCDFWRIPKLILELQPSYMVYLRHYTETIYETVMYFVPPMGN